MTTTNVETIKTKVAQLRESLHRELQAVNSNTRYHDSGRRLELAKVRKTHRERAETLKREYTEAVTARRTYLQKEAFGLPKDGDAVAYRNAVDRVSTKTPFELTELLNQATITNDHTLLRAIGAKAYANGMTGLLDAYAKQGPGASTTWISELQDLPTESAINFMFLMPGAQPSRDQLSAAEMDQLDAETSRLQPNPTRPPSSGSSAPQPDTSDKQLAAAAFGSHNPDPKPTTDWWKD